MEINLDTVFELFEMWLSLFNWKSFLLMGAVCECQGWSRLLYYQVKRWLGVQYNTQVWVPSWLMFEIKCAVFLPAMNHRAVIFLDRTSQATSYGSVNSKKNGKFVSGTFSWMSQFDFPGIW